MANSFGAQQVNVQQYRNPTKGLQDALSGIYGNVVADRKREDLLAQQAIQNKMAQDRLGIAQAGEARAVSDWDTKNAQEKALAAIYGTVPQTGTSTKTVTSGGTAGTPIVPGNQAEIATTQADNLNTVNAIDALNAETALATDKYDNLRSKYISDYTTPKKIQMRPDERNITAENAKQVVLKEYPKVPGESKRTYYETADGKKIDMFSKFFGGYEKVDNFSNNATGDRTIYDVNDIKAPGEAIPLAESKALQESGLLGINTKFNNLDTEIAEVPKLIKDIAATPGTKGTSKEVTVTKELDNAAKAAYLRDKIMKDGTLLGSVKQAALSKVDAIYPQAKEMTVKDQLALLKYKKDAIGEVQTVSDYRDIYPNMPASIKSVKGAKAYADKMDRKSKKDASGNFKAMLYKNITGKDSDDVASIDTWLKVNSDKLKAMSKGDKSALVEKFKALYVDEAEYLDFTDYFGGSAAGDVLGDRNL